ncbi:hypothetical protein [Methylovorus glucosotrophus]|uniref:Uncharacterized protein n=1 Tax=Methylovorus glucosotrophus (strain SIP3-4) TaxID=582744 RepID=C6X7X0_METGS|nr:hypothetical protein [Methylovorus glucosotrophus]ACT51297.1 hypothetical protein Msip34_2055 [Methylovorus glucosotrophus SIP3-4]
MKDFELIYNDCLKNEKFNTIYNDYLADFKIFIEILKMTVRKEQNFNLKKFNSFYSKWIWISAFYLMNNESPLTKKYFMKEVYTSFNSNFQFK